MPLRSIILIDDNKVDLQFCKIAMDGLNLKRPVITFADAEEAFKHIAEKAASIFAIICDVKMPGMDGMELLEKINKDKTLKMLAIPFIFFSNSDRPEDIAEAYNLTAQGYFVKPMEVSELQSIFQSIIGYWSACRVPDDRYKN